MESTEIGRFPATAISGYTGHIPGMRPDSYYGGSRAQYQRGARAPDFHHNGSLSQSMRKGLPYRAGLDVVGYTGFVPFKTAGNVFGQTFARSNYNSMKVKFEQLKSINPARDAFVDRARNLLEGVRPSSRNGNYPLYVAQENSRSTVNNHVP